MHSRTLLVAVVLMMLLPVLIVATPVVSATTTVFYADADSGILSQSADSNYGTTATINCGYDGAGHTYRMLIHFDLSSINGASITSATLKVYKGSGYGSPYFNVYKCTSSWTETGVTWNNQPTHDGSYLAQSPLGSSNAITVTSAVSSWVSGSNYGVIAISYEEGVYHYAELRAREYGSGYIPELSVTYTASSHWAPSFTSSPTTTAYVGHLWSYTPTCNETVTFTADTTPSWATWYSGNSTYVGRPDATGGHSFKLKAHSTGGTYDAWQNFTVTASVLHYAPAFTSTPSTYWGVGFAYSYHVTLNESSTIYVDTKPSWASYDGVDDITGTPSTPNSDAFNIRAVDSVRGDTAYQNFTVTVVSGMAATDYGTAYQYNPAGTYQSSTDPWIWAGAHPTESNAAAYGYYKWNVTGYTNHVLSYKLKLKVQGGNFGSDHTTSISVYMVTAPWHGPDLCWNTKPTNSATLITNEMHVANVNDVWTFNVTTAVNAWIDGTSNYGLVFKLGGGGYYNILEFDEDTIATEVHEAWAATFTSTPSSWGHIGTTYSYSPTCNTTVTFTSMTKPAAASFSGSAYSWTPSTAGVYAFVLRAYTVSGTLYSYQYWNVTVNATTTLYGAMSFDSDFYLDSYSDYAGTMYVYGILLASSGIFLQTAWLNINVTYGVNSVGVFGLSTDFVGEYNDASLAFSDIWTYAHANHAIGNYIIKIWYDSEGHEPYDPSNVVTLTFEMYPGWTAMHYINDTLYLPNMSWYVMHYINDTIYGALPMPWYPMNTLTGDFRGQSAPAISEALVFGIVWLIMIFMPAIVLNNAMERMGFLIGFPMMLMVFAFTQPNFWYIAIIGCAGAIIAWWRGEL